MAEGNLLNTYVIGFDRAIRETVETKGGKLRQYVQRATGDLFRKEGVYQRTAGGGLPQKVTNRFGDSPVSDIEYSRRRTTRTAYQDGQFMDWADVSKMGVDPRNAKLNAMRNKFLRQEDIILDQAFLGKALGGVEGQTSTYLTDAVNLLKEGGGLGSSTITTGFTYEKFLNALQAFGTNSVDIETETPIFKISWNQWQDMMLDEQFINFDYTANRPIDRGVGAIYDYMGAKFCISNILPYFADATVTLGADSGSETSIVPADSELQLADTNIDSTGKWTVDTDDIRAVYAFIQDAVLLEVNPDMTTKISERADKSFNYYAYMKAEFGAVRMEEEKVIVIPSKEGVASNSN